MQKINANEKLKFHERFGYGVGEIAGALNGAMSAFITMYYTDSVGLSLGTAGLILLLSKIFDGISDLLAGILVDRTRTKWGKARPWLLWLCIPAGLTYALMFWVPENISGTGKIIYAFLTYNLFSAVIYTIVGVAKTALLPRITMNSVERGKLSSYSLLFGLIGASVMISLTFPLMNMLGGGENAWKKVFSIYGIVMTVGLAICFLSTKERVGDEEVSNETAKKEKKSFKESFVNLFHNKYFLIALGLYVLYQLSMQIAATAGTYFFTYVMEDQMLMSSTALWGTIPQLFSIFILVDPCLKYLGKKKSLYLGAGLSLISCVLKVLGGLTGNAPLIYISTIIGGLAGGPMAVPMALVLADSIDYGEYKYGERTEGIGSSVVTFAQKVAAGVTGYIVTLVLSLTGYVAGEKQTFTAQMGILTVTTIIPAAISLLTIGISMLYDYEKKETEVKAKISGQAGCE